MKYLNIFKANKEIERLEGLIESSKADASVEALKAKDGEIANLRQTISAYPGVKQQYDADMAALKLSHETAVSDLKASHEKAVKDLTDGHEAALTDLQGQLETAKTETNVKVHSVISSLGVSTDAVRTPVEADNNQTPEAISAQFHSMKPGLERNAFYQKHRDTILKVMVPLKK